MGKFDTHGGTFVPQGFMRIEAGGTHEENPNGGVQVGVDPNGVPNMVEEDENIYQDFVYSNKIKAERDILKEFNLPEKFEGKSYSDIVNEYVDEQRPDDPITNKTMNAMLSRLAEAQEKQKELAEMKEIEDELAKLSPEELEQLEAMLSQQKQEAGQQPQMFETGGPKKTITLADGTQIEVNDDHGEINEWNPSRFETWSDDFKDKHKEGLALIGGLNKTVGKAALAASILGGWNPAGTMRGLNLIGSGTNGVRVGANGQVVLSEAAPLSTRLAGSSSDIGFLGRIFRGKKDMAKLAASELRVAPKAVETVQAVAPAVTQEVVPAVEETVQAAKSLSNASKWKRAGIGLGVLGGLAGLGWVGKRSGAYDAIRNAVNYDPYDVFTPDTTSVSGAPIDWDNVDVSSWASGYKNGGLINRYDEGSKLEPVASKEALERLASGIPTFSATIPTKIVGGPEPVESYYIDYNKDKTASKEVLERLASDTWAPLSAGNFNLKRIEMPASLIDKRNLSSLQSGISDVSTNVPSTIIGGPKPVVPYRIDYDINESDNKDMSLPTWSRYAGAFTSGLLGLYNAFQKPDEYKSKPITPVLSRTKVGYINPVYRPQDANMAVNDVLASGAGTIRGLRNSGLGPSTASAMIAADSNIGRNIGTSRTQIGDYNANLLNSIIAQINGYRQAEAQLGINRDKINTGLLYDAATRNAQNDLALQQLNYGSEGQKYAALSGQIDQVADALSSSGRENMAYNMINNNPAFAYYILKNGETPYKGYIAKCGGLLKRYKK